MPCHCVDGGGRDATAAEKIQQAAIEEVQLRKLADIERALDEIETPTVDASLDRLSTVLGQPLDVDKRRLADIPTRFFIPCKAADEDLLYETWRAQPKWVNRVDADPMANIHFPDTKSHWFKACIRLLRRIEPNIWETFSDHHEIQEEIGLQLPYFEFYGKQRPRPSLPYRVYMSSYALLAHMRSDKPHSSCILLESGLADEGSVLRSEIDAVITLSQYQSQHGFFTHHHTKPVLVACILRDEAARITQGYFDGTRNKLVLRQSRILDLRGSEPTDDAWTLLRWIVSAPVGETGYAKSAERREALFDDAENLPPRLLVSCPK